MNDNYPGATKGELLGAPLARRLAAYCAQRQLFPHRGAPQLTPRTLVLGGWDVMIMFGKWHRRLTGLLAGMAAVALLATACGVPSSSSSANSANSATGGTTNYSKELAFAQCVRSDGVPNFPDPQSNGSFAVKSSALGVSQSVVQAAEGSCQHLLPNGGQVTAAQRGQAVQAALKYSQCMRAHGAANYPDPKVSDNGATISISGHGIDPNSPQFQTARRACRSLRPGSLNG